MRIEVYGSGSSGNCYGISDGETSFLMECGVPMKHFNKVSGFSLAQFAAVVTSHSHGDHSATIAEMHRRGLTCYCTAETARVYAIDGQYGVNIVKPKESIKIGTFTLIPFPLKHNHTQTMEPCECFGYLVYSCVTKERLLFVTDTMYIENQFKNLNYVMLEVNYVKALLSEDYDFIDARRVQTHMSLETAVDFLKHQDLSSVRQIIATHLSDSRADEEYILRALRRSTGKACYIARAGLTLG